jgi:two-component system sensor histidine kinase EvgS
VSAPVAGKRVFELPSAVRPALRICAVLLLALHAASAAVAASDAGLTPVQKTWIAGHTARLGLTRTNWPPFDIVSQDGKYTGITADYLALLQARTGLRVQTVLFDDWPQALAAARKGEVDFLGSMSRTAERDRFLDFTAPYVTNPAVIVARKDAREIRGIGDLKGRTVAVESGFAAAEVLKSRQPGIRLLEVRTTAEALLEVSLGRADAYVGDLIVSTWLIDRNYLTNLEVRGSAPLASGDLRFAVRKAAGPLRAILDAGLARLSEEDHQAIRQRWVPITTSAGGEAQRKIALTPAERAWIAAHPVIRVGVDPGWEPLDFLDASGRHSGLASEYLRILRERLGLNLVVVPTRDWSQTMDQAKARQLDMVALITRTAEREKDFRFTQPYVGLPMVIVTRTDERFASDLPDLEGRTVAVIKDYFAAEYLAASHPRIVQLPVANMDEALEAVNRGYAFATLGSVATLGQRLQKRYLGKLKIAGAPGLMQDLSMATRTDWPQLAALLDKGLASVSEEERQAFNQKWLSLRIEYGVDWREVAKIALPIAVAVLIVLAVILVANRRLKRQILETERKDAALQVQLAFQRTLMDTIPSPILFKDTDARIYGCNRAFELAFGITREQMLGFTDTELDILTPGLRQRLYEDDVALLKEPSKTLHDQLVMPFADGRDHVVLYWKTVFLLGDGMVGGLLSVLVDITPLKELEKAAGEARDAADAANRAKSAFLATMSHEIRTPMNAVLGMLELMSLTRLDDDQQRTLGVVRESAKSLLRIIDDILDFSKIEAGRLEIKPEAVAVADVVDSVFLVYAGIASSKNLLLRKSVDARIAPALLADGLRLRQILNNFVSNALKFTAAGEVEIRAELLEASPQSQVLRLSVRDTGIGIPAQSQARLFQPFMQAESDTTRRYGGTGLGLAICRRLAGLMGGEVTMQSQEGSGTTMVFTAAFPLADEADLKGDRTLSEAAARKAFTVRRAAPDVARAQAEGTLVLLADDHPTNRLLLVRQLNALGYAAEAVEDGVAALEKVRSGRFSLLITDCHMPEMDGYQLAREIRRLEAASGGPRLPIVACTANALQGEAANCFEAGMDDYLPKPVEMAQLMRKLDRWLPLPEAPAPGGPAPIAADVLAGMSGGDAALEREILADYLRSNEQDGAQIAQAYAQRNAEALRRTAHRMKGAARMVGAMALADLAGQIESEARDARWEALDRLRPAFGAELQKVAIHVGRQATGQELEKREG